MRPTLALLRSSHPGPVVAVTVITVLLGVAVGLEPWRLAVLGGTLLLNQLSIGLANDWLDAERDRAAGRADKPVARGEVAVSTVRAAAVIAGVASIAVSATLGVPFLIAHAVALAGGWAYDLGLKRTAISAVPYLVSFGLLPALATLALPAPALPAWWAVACGSFLGLAAHIANALPDLADDAATGVRGMPHRLGRSGATVVAGAALAAAAVCIAVGTGFGDLLTLVGLGASLAASAGAVGFGLRGDRWGFRLVMAAALLDVVLLVLAGDRVIA